MADFSMDTENVEYPVEFRLEKRGRPTSVESQLGIIEFYLQESAGEGALFRITDSRINKRYDFFLNRMLLFPNNIPETSDRKLIITFRPSRKLYLTFLVEEEMKRFYDTVREWLNKGSDAADENQSIDPDRDSPEPSENNGANGGNSGNGDDGGSGTSRKRRRISETATGASASAPGTPSTPHSQLLLECPICLDTFQKIKTDGKRSITATSCGHLFCDACLNDVIARKGPCPTCRKKLTRKSTRTIFM